MTEMASGTTAHRYYVHVPERVVAIVTRGGSEPGTRYVHVDHLGSSDVLTREDGTIQERRSYDPFGKRRNPIWGQPPPMSFSSTTTLGFTGHESDDELGLVNMKGRIFDPKVGRFLTTDPIISAPFSGQSWNPFSYVLNNPLSYVDPSGFEPDTVPFERVEFIYGPNGDPVGLKGTGTITFDYDGDEQRIRKTTPTEETLYFGGLYERVTEMSAGTTTHRYYVHSPERVVAIVTRGGTNAGTRYVHADHLGSVDAVTLEDGSIDERRSYDAFGQHRNPVWGQPPPMSFSSTTTLGFTGHESDDELGLVNMKGRIYDPKVGRFLTTDPIISAPLSGQTWNPYSYVANNPLTFVDPSGFEPDTVPFERVEFIYGPNGDPVGLKGILPPPDPPEKKDDGEKVGAYVPPVDVSPTGNTATYDPDPVTTADEGGGNAVGAAELSLGFGVGAVTGYVPGAAVLEQIGTTVGLENEWLEPRPDLQLGIALGQIAGGLVRVVQGGLLIKGGGALSATGLGAIAGVPAIVAGATWAAAGTSSILAGIHGLTKALSTGSGSGAAAGTASRPPAPPNGTRMTKNDALTEAERFLGENYRDAGRGRFVSADGTRQVRMGDSDILGRHGGGPHMNFEQLAPDPITGRMTVTNNSHVYFTD